VSLRYLSVAPKMGKVKLWRKDGRRNRVGVLRLVGGGVSTDGSSSGVSWGGGS